MLLKKCLLIACAGLVALPVNAKVTEYVREHNYQATRFDSEYTSRINAIEGVKKELLDEIGTYIQSVITIKEDSKGNDFFSRDTVALTAGIISMKVLKENWDFKQFYVKASMKTDPDDVKKAVENLRNDYQLEQTLRDSLQELNKSRKQVAKLQQQLKQTQNTTHGLQLAKAYVAAVQGVDAEEKFKGLIISKVYGNFDQAFKQLSELANQGNATAQLRLGYMYERGMGVEQDYAKARQWYEKAIQTGSVTAIGQLGFLYERGMGVEQNFTKAVSMYRDAINKGSAYAYAKLGYLYQTAEGVSRDYDEAYRLYKKASDAGVPFAWARIGHFYQRGIAVPKDFDKAIEYYNKAVEVKQPLAMALLGFMYIKGWGVEQDYEKANQLIRESVRYKNPLSLSYLGFIYEQGLGAEQDYDKAIELYEKSIEMGSTFGEFRMGIMYLKGNGVIRDVDTALEYLEKAAKKGHPKAKEVYERVSSRF